MINLLRVFEIGRFNGDERILLSDEVFFRGRYEKWEGVFSRYCDGVVF